MKSRVFDFLKQSRTANRNNHLLNHIETKPKDLFDVFINHRGTDTKRNIACLLYDNLSRRNLRPFLDNKSLKPGDKLFDHIDRAIVSSKVSVAIFSPNYGQSYSCLHELALMMESKKRVIPIFYDIKPSQLDILIDRDRCSEEVIERFRWALDEARHTIGLTFDSMKGNLSEIVTVASDIVVERLMELEVEEDNNM
ncbi:PREDICTED: toll/interleukin-1 receptor-like protein [Tarenaya hassleriana]|uniref:toll/interleukin-1 receptor-like protein n=1 Tax=Tarenaya hassleriana TaxID=28532 RepID=UPI00053C5F90|nr:PREDICTED: toll/interleukin-1 receptor-like protein [Tarenaya hassleriana]